MAVAQATSVIHGKLMYEGKLVAAAIYASGILQGRFKYVFSGQGNTRAIAISARIRGESEDCALDVKLFEVITDNKIWKTQPDQQLVYASTRVWARRFTPEVMLGVYTPEEFDENGVPDPALSQHLMPQSTKEPLPAAEPGAPIGAAAESAAPVAATQTAGPATPPPGETKPAGKAISEGMLRVLKKKASVNKIDEAKICSQFAVARLEDLTGEAINKAMAFAGQPA